LGNPDISTITLSQARKYVLSLQSRNITSISLQTYTRAVRGFLTWCFNEEYISTDISEKLRLPKATRKAVDVLTDEEISRLLRCFDTKTLIGLRDMVVVLLMLDSGLRLSEVARLEYGKIHLEAGYLIAHGKGNKERYIPLGLQTKKYLIKYLSLISPATTKDKIVVKDHLIPATAGTISNLFRRLKKRSKIPRLRPHLLRHSFATRYLSLGGDVYNLQAILGHTTLEMVKRYVQLTPGEKVINFTQFSPIDNLAKKP
jgi:integrase/recombinase XerC/integrase/recombinase XerD